MARKAGGVAVLFDQLNATYPRRSRRSDGWIGDPAHRARVSDHNPDRNGVVHAGDYTHDPANGVDAHRLADELAASGDPRIKYIISRGRFWQNGRWSRYTGPNPHNQHMHLSVKSGIGDQRHPWRLPMLKNVAPSQPTPPRKDKDLTPDESRWLRELHTALATPRDASVHHENIRDDAAGHIYSIRDDLRDLIAELKRKGVIDV